MKKIILIAVVILLLVSVPVVVFFVGQQQDLRTKAAPATTLSIQPNVNSVPAGEIVICTILINTAENKVASAKISLLFDQTKFEAQSITNGTLAPRILNQGTVGAGTATITVAAQSTAKPITGQGDIAVLRLKAIGGSTTPVAIQFAPDTFVAGIGEKPVNVLVSSQGASISIIGGTIADSPTTITPTPSTQTTPTPTSQQPESLFSQPASASALTLYVHTEATRAGIPLIQGTATPSASVTVVVYSTPPQTIVVTADTNGNWETKTKTALASGTYNIVVTALLADTGTSETLSSTFTIGGGIGGAGVGGETSETLGDELPESGSIGLTVFLLSIACLSLFSGVVLLAKKPYEYS